MYVIKEMRINKFEPRPIISNRELFISSGEKRATVESKETSDVFDAPTLSGASKVKALGLAQSVRAKASEHVEEHGAEPLHIDARNR